MIARIWRGRTRAEHADTYLDYLRATGLPGYAATAGNQVVRVLHRIEEDVAEFVLISFWESRPVIEAFAGPDIETAVYYPADDDYLLEREPTVAHYDVVVDQAGPEKELEKEEEHAR